jgi:hypothetical protein
MAKSFAFHKESAPRNRRMDMQRDRNEKSKEYFGPLNKDWSVPAPPASAPPPGEGNAIAKVEE